MNSLVRIAPVILRCHRACAPVLISALCFAAFADPVPDPLREIGLSVIPTPRQVRLDVGDACDLRRGLRLSGDTPLPQALRAALANPGAAGGVPVTVTPPRNPEDDLWTCDQAYVVTVSAQRVSVEAATPRAAFYAGQTLAQLAASDRPVPALTIRDWPAIPNRIAMIATDQGGFQVIDVDYWKRIIRELAAVKMTAVMPYFDAGTFKYRKHPYLGQKGDEGFTVEKARLLSDYAAQHFIELIPQQNSLGHLGGALAHTELSHLRDGGGTINMVLPETLTFLGDLYDDLVEGFPNASAIHVGGDEFGHGFGQHPAVAKRIAEIGGPAVYAHFLIQLRQMLRERNRGMMIWWHEQGFTMKAADRLAKDITVFDWHYGPQKDFPSLDRLTEAGFTNTWATPAVTRFYNGSDDWNRTFANIGGFAEAAAKRNIPGICTCTWVHGMWGGRNMFELNIYGLLYSAECGWNATRRTTAPEFAEAYAQQWFGVRAQNAADLIAQAVHMPYGTPEEQGFWRDNRALEPICGAPLAASVDLTHPEHNRDDQAHTLIAFCDRADAAIDALRAAATRNTVTLDYLQHDVRIHRLAAERLLAAAELNRWCAGLRPVHPETGTQVLNATFDTPDLPQHARAGDGATLADGDLTTAPLANWKRDGLTVGPLPLPETGLQIEYDVCPIRWGKQFQQFASVTPSGHHYMIFVTGHVFNVYTRFEGNWARQSAVATSCKLNTWYHCTVRIRPGSLSFTAVERDTGTPVCRTGALPLDNPGTTLTFDLTDNHGDEAQNTASKWDNLLVSELAPAPHISADPPTGIINRLQRLIGLHHTIENTFERSIREAGGGSTEAGGIGKGGVNFRSRQGRRDLEDIVTGLEKRRIPRSFLE